MGSLPNLETPPLSSRISTVVPATPRDEENGAYQLNYMDLLMKLHYIRPVYFFNSEAVQGLSISDLKKPMFPLLDPYFHVSGRIRRSESGRPYIKCNDAGVRIAESHCDTTLGEWLDENGYSAEGLVHDHVLGPDLAFSPLVFLKVGDICLQPCAFMVTGVGETVGGSGGRDFLVVLNRRKHTNGHIEFTWFKCGGLSVGLSWAHVLGDAFSAFNFITKWSQILAGHAPPKFLHMPNLAEPQFLPKSVSENPISVKKVNIVGEYWLAANDNDVVTHTFHITSKQLHHLVSTTSTCDQDQTNDTAKTNTSFFEIISALVWKTIAQIREDSGPRVVTICTTDSSNRAENEFPTNDLVLSKIEADLVVEESDISELARLIAEQKIVENHVMEKLVEEGEGKEDFIVYGANLTFVDLEETDFYELKLNGHKPIMANCTFRGVGDQGVVLVFPAPDEDNEDGAYGRIVTVSLPVKELDQLKDKLGGEWGIHCIRTEF